MSRRPPSRAGGRRVDLHAHTIFSDGLLSPEALVARAAQKGLVALAITDHDSVEALPRALAAAPPGLELVPGIEISTSLEGLDLHLLGYGYRGLPPDPLVYLAALPRLIELFARAGVRATLFVVGRDAEAQSTALRMCTELGHEIASHSLTHPLALASLDDGALARELDASRQVLGEAAGAPVVGFRAPNFDMNRRTLATLAACGYRYDASGYPTPMLLAARLVLAMKSGDPIGVMRLRPWPFTWRRGPHELRFAATDAARGSPGREAGAPLALRQFPVAVTRGVRFPVYHTLRYAMSDARFERLVDGFARRGETLSYVLHAVDALGLAEDRVDARLGRHPGLHQPLERKLALLERTLHAIAVRFECMTFRERLDAA